MNSHFVKQQIKLLYGNVGYVHNNHMQNLRSQKIPSTKLQISCSAIIMSVQFIWE